MWAADSSSMGVPDLNIGYGVRLAGPLRAVRVGNHFICGICRRRFDSEGKAWHCVDQCWNRLLSLDPVVMGRRNFKQRFFCRFCAREFTAKAAAEKCAGECLRDLSAKRQRERALADYESEDHPIDPQPQATSRGTEPNSVVLNAQPQVLHKVVITNPLPKPEPEPEELGDVSSESSVAEPASTRQTPRDVPDEEKFFRDAAKYACKECSVRYFTRAEVIRCYDGH